jgi:predicted ATP-binding protein involved in virulence
VQQDLVHLQRAIVRNLRDLIYIDVNFARPDGTTAGWTVLAGPKGCGKSILLKANALCLAWRQNIGLWLPFPNIQFLVTPHGPRICHATGPGGLFCSSAPAADVR